MLQLGTTSSSPVSLLSRLTSLPLSHVLYHPTHKLQGCPPFIRFPSIAPDTALDELYQPLESRQEKLPPPLPLRSILRTADGAAGGAAIQQLP